MLQKMLVALDGSDQSFKALDSALDIAAGCRVVEVEVMTVVPTTVMIGGAPTGTGGAQKYAESVVEKAAKICREKVPGLQAKTKVDEGHPAQLIVEEAREGKYDLIVVGRHGHGGVPRLELGSVSRKVVDWATVPVLVIK